MRFLYENNYTVLNINEVIKAIKSPNHVLRSGRRGKRAITLMMASRFPTDLLLYYKNTGLLSSVSPKRYD